MSSPATYPSTADTVIVQHHWWDANTRRGVAADVTFTPITTSGGTLTPNLVDQAAHAWIKTRTWTARPDPYSGYLAVPLTATNDPDLSSLTGFGGYRVQGGDGSSAEAPFTVAVDAAADEVTVTEQMSRALAQLNPPVSLEPGDQVKAVWLTDLASITAPTPPTSYYTAPQTTALVLDAVGAHDDDPGAHPDIRALITGSGTGAPTGGAGGVLSGSYPSPGFAVDMCTQAEHNAHVNSANPHPQYDDTPSLLLKFENGMA